MSVIPCEHARSARMQDEEPPRRPCSTPVRPEDSTLKPAPPFTMPATLTPMPMQQLTTPTQDATRQAISQSYQTEKGLTIYPPPHMLRPSPPPLPSRAPGTPVPNFREVAEFEACIPHLLSRPAPQHITSANSAHFHSCRLLVHRICRPWSFINSHSPCSRYVDCFSRPRCHLPLQRLLDSFRHSSHRRCPPHTILHSTRSSTARGQASSTSLALLQCHLRVLLRVQATPGPDAFSPGPSWYTLLRLQRRAPPHDAPRFASSTHYASRPTGVELRLCLGGQAPRLRFERPHCQEAVLIQPLIRT